MRRLRDVGGIRRLLGLGRSMYREALNTPAGAMVMADLRTFCQCKPEQLDWEYLEREMRNDLDAYKEHMARARVYFRMRRFLDTTDAQLDAAEQNIAEMGGDLNG